MFGAEGEAKDGRKWCGRKNKKNQRAQISENKEILNTNDSGENNQKGGITETRTTMINEKDKATGTQWKHMPKNNKHIIMKAQHMTRITKYNLKRIET